MNQSRFALLSWKPLFRPAFRAWVGAGRTRPALWRILIGVFIIGVCWGASMVLAIGTGLGLWIIREGATLEEALSQPGTYGSFGEVEPVVLVPLILASFSGIWVGAAITLAWLHKRGFGSMLSAPGRWRWSDFGTGVLIVASFYVMATAVQALTQSGSPLSFGGAMAWGWVIVPLLVLVLIQSGAEEVLLRGYLQQQLAARCRNPLIWFVLPSLAFGALHWQPGWTGVFYIAVTTLFGLAAAASVWRTGSLAGAMGLHFANNGVLFALQSPQAVVDGLLSGASNTQSLADFLSAGLFFLVLLVWILSSKSPFRSRPRARPIG